ncbi:DUF3263 domain-containing protein [Subtercola sp. YIM 133946]|uniref:DUF3263 domain-containing protein n=1 Tax=Subtercola sp. YIM 133946 TaxID=3118909 RepID=UPI003FCE3EA8
MVSGDEHTLLAFEDAHPSPYPAKESDVRAAFGMSLPRYYQKLLQLVQQPDVVAEFPQLAKRMLERQERARRAREARLLRRGAD